MSDKTPQAYGIKLASEVTGLSVAMVDYLCRTGVLVPTRSRRRGRGSPRMYSFADLVMLRTLAELLKAGVGVAKLKRSLQALQRSHPQAQGEPSNARFLVTDGAGVFFSNSSRRLLEEIPSGQFAFRFVVEMQTIRHHVSKRLAAVKADGTQLGEAVR